MNLKSVLVVVCLGCVTGVSGEGLAAAGGAFGAGAALAQGAPAQTAVTRRIGAIKAISGSVITLTPDAGPEIMLTVQASTRLVKTPPGEKDLKNATPVALGELQVGDRILAGGRVSEDGKSMLASSLVVMKRTDVEARQEQVRQDWQKRGLGGLVSSVDAATGTVTISIMGTGGTKKVAVHSSKDTVFRRYAADSVKFEDAKLSTLQQVKPGDQLRARGDKNTDGTEFTAEEIVTGSFRNIAGTVNGIDAAAGVVSVQDLLSKKTMAVKITSESQLHKLPAEMAQRIAMRLKGAMPPGVAGAGASVAAGAASAPVGNGQSHPGGPPSGGMGQGGGVGGGARSGGAPDLQQLLNRLPAVALADLHKGDAVMIVATQGTESGGGTAITLLSGVEPILQAAPSQAMMLTPWSLGGGPGGDAGNQ